MEGIPLSPSITIKLAQTRHEFEEAFRLLQRSQRELGLAKPEGDLWVLKHHALPSTNTVVAIQAGPKGNQVIAAVCLFGESPYHLPMESRLNLSNFRENLEGRLAELSLAGFHSDFTANDDLKLALFHFVYCFGASYCHYDGFVTEAPLAQTKELVELLRYERIFEPLNNRQLLFLNVREGRDLRGKMGSALTVEYEFPEKKFFLVAHQSMEPAVLDYLFNERTRLFASLDDFELRVLKNIYDYGDYARVLPSRSLAMPEKRSPRYPRFPMNCEGYLTNIRGQRENVQVLDVSREGLKIRAPQSLARGTSYMLTVFVGVNRQTELIATVIWVDEVAEMAGLELKSHDRSWTQLIEYLEKDFLRVA
jgi:hypothetical protein